MFERIDILDEHDALLDAVDSAIGGPECEVCGEPTEALDEYGWCGACRDNDDPSPMCNCGECLAGNYTCVRSD